jgi:hypothetical protein
VSVGGRDGRVIACHMERVTYDMSDIPPIRLDKTKIRIGTIERSKAEEIAYWRGTTVKERLQHIERLRRLNYGDRATERLQRTIRITKCE